MDSFWSKARVTAAVLSLTLSMTALADGSLWSELPSESSASDVGAQNRTERVAMTRHLRINRDALDALIDQGLESPRAAFTLDLPLPNGGFREFEFRLAGTMSPVLAAKFPNIRAFSGRSLDKGMATAQMELTPAGLSAQILASGGRWMIDPSDQSDVTRVKSYFARDAKRGDSPFQCGVTDNSHLRDLLNQKPKQAKLAQSSQPLKESRSRGAELRTYRIAVATTGEYSENHGGSVDGALSAVVKVINRVNGIFNAELSVGFTLIDNNDLIIFTDPDTDDFEGNGDTEVLIDESQKVIDEIIGSENYDIGHTFSTSPGGLASTGPCDDDYKARGVSGGVSGDAFAVDYVAHEIGHQFSMSHTFNSSHVDCVEQRASSTAFEPGSGTTIMSYSGICPGDNVPQPHLQNNNADPMFHSISYEQAADYVEGFGATCGVTSDTGNSHPEVEAGAEYIVPANTALVLAGSGADSDGNVLSYSWEQRDLGPAAALSAPDNGSIPLFRVYAPVESGQRYLPRLSTLVSGDFTDAEKSPSKSRDMNFTLTARDGLGGRNSDDTAITVAAAPLVGKSFSLAEPDLGGSLGKVGTVRWNVGETDVSPILAKEVELYLSIDGGATFQSTPFVTVANDGYARVEFPSGINTDEARLMVKGRDNIFFDISAADFALNSSAAATPEVPAPENVKGSVKSDTVISLDFSPGAANGVNYYDAVCVGEPAISPVSGSATSAQGFDHTQSITSSVSLSGDGLISPTGVSVSVDISHTYRGDVIIKLISPSGTVATLKDFDGLDQSQDVKETYLVSAMAGELPSGEWRLEVSDGYEGDDGVLNSWSLTGEAVTAPRTVAGSTAPALTIDDSKAVTSQISLSAEGEVSPDEFEVEVDITHTWRSDLLIELETPSGKRITLRDPDTDDSADDVIGAFPTSLRAETPFSELAGETLSGTWSLHIEDRFAGDDGTLNSWGIAQTQYLFSGRGTSSPVEVRGLPTDQSYNCSIAGVYSDVTPPRQSESRAAGKITVGTLPFNSQAESTFLSLLETVLTLGGSASSGDVAIARGSQSGAEKVVAADAADSRPNAIPTLNAWGLAMLMLLMGLVGRRWGKASPKQS